MSSHWKKIYKSYYMYLPESDSEAIYFLVLQPSFDLQ